MKRDFIIYVGLLVILAALTILAPAEKTLGDLVKLVYLHGAVMKITLYLLYLSGFLGLNFLIIKGERTYKLMAATNQTVMFFSFFSLVASIIAAAFIWRTINWQEPRLILLVGLAGLTFSGYLLVQGEVKKPVIAVYKIFVAVIIYAFTLTAERIMHPHDPIGTSVSANIKVFYLLITMTVAAIAGLTIVGLIRKN